MSVYNSITNPAKIQNTKHLTASLASTLDEFNLTTEQALLIAVRVMGALEEGTPSNPNGQNL